MHWPCRRCRQPDSARPSSLFAPILGSIRIRCGLAALFLSFSFVNFFDSIALSLSVCICAQLAGRAYSTDILFDFLLVLFLMISVRRTHLRNTTIIRTCVCRWMRCHSCIDAMRTHSVQHKRIGTRAPISVESCEGFICSHLPFFLFNKIIFSGFILITYSTRIL